MCPRLNLTRSRGPQQRPRRFLPAIRTILRSFFSLRAFHAILTPVALTRAAIGRASRMRTLVTVPSSFGHGLIGNALTPLLSGGDIVLHPLGQRLAGDLGRIIDEFRIGFLSSVPAFWPLSHVFAVYFAPFVARYLVDDKPAFWNGFVA